MSSKPDIDMGANEKLFNRVAKMIRKIRIVKCPLHFRTKEASSVALVDQRTRLSPSINLATRDASEYQVSS